LTLKITPLVIDQRSDKTTVLPEIPPLEFLAATQ
jgi:hypothetical protein